MNARFVFLGFAALCAALTSCSNGGSSGSSFFSSGPQVVRQQGFECAYDDYVSTQFFTFDDKGRVRSVGVLDGENIFSIDREFNNFYPYFAEGTFQTDSNGFVTSVRAKCYEGGSCSARFSYDEYGRLVAWRVKGAQGDARARYKRDAEGRIYGAAGQGERMHSIRDYATFELPNKHALYTHAEADLLFGAEGWGDVLPDMFLAGLLGRPANWLLTGIGSEENEYELNDDGLILSEKLPDKPAFKFLYADDFTVSPDYAGQAVQTTSRVDCKVIKPEEY
ncbi:MAG: hypothetical protein U0K36_10730 [Bacteroidales bacterium]|nr:hypothetical protein [Bacteroidales bacterium]